jgi:pyruvate formate lyase activating enzyme
LIGNVHSIETFGTVDGPGIRFVVFLQGCPLRCQYCHNPDTWEYNGGQQKTVEEIMEEFAKYKAFLTNGGLTVTGGEPLVQMDFVTELFQKAKEQGAHTCLDTSGITFQPQSVAMMKKFDRLMEVTDLVMLDIKHIDKDEHEVLTGRGQGAVLDFARYISEKPNTELWIRHVVVPGITDKPEYLKRIGEFLATLPKVNALDVLPYHTMGTVKYENLGMEYPLKDVPAMSKEGAIQAKNTILRAYQKAKKTLA